VQLAQSIVDFLFSSIAFFLSLPCESDLFRDDLGQSNLVVRNLMLYGKEAVSGSNDCGLRSEAVCLKFLFAFQAIGRMSEAMLRETVSMLRIDLSRSA